jgi:hypothetical protein
MCSTISQPKCSISPGGNHPISSVKDHLRSAFWSARRGTRSGPTRRVRAITLVSVVHPSTFVCRRQPVLPIGGNLCSPYRDAAVGRLRRVRYGLISLYWRCFNSAQAAGTSERLLLKAAIFAAFPSQRNPITGRQSASNRIEKTYLHPNAGRPARWVPPVRYESLPSHRPQYASVQRDRVEDR